MIASARPANEGEARCTAVSLALGVVLPIPPARGLRADEHSQQHHDPVGNVLGVSVDAQ